MNFFFNDFLIRLPEFFYGAVLVLLFWFYFKPLSVFNIFSTDKRNKGAVSPLEKFIPSDGRGLRGISDDSDDNASQISHSDKINIGRILSDFIIQKYLLIAVLAFRIFYAFLLSGLQYYIWSRGGVAKFLLPPYSPITYFLRYSWTHFFMNAVWSVGAAIVFYLVLKMIEKKMPGFFGSNTNRTFFGSQGSVRGGSGGNEPELGLLCALIIGWPGFVVFVPIFFVILLAGYLMKFTNLARRVPGWCSVSLAFLLAVLIVMIFENKLLDVFNLTVLKI